eukprot:1956714-Pyramimonas_sp.AAC.2
MFVSPVPDVEPMKQEWLATLQHVPSWHEAGPHTNNPKTCCFVLTQPAQCNIHNFPHLTHLVIPTPPVGFRELVVGIVEAKFCPHEPSIS